MPAATCAAIYLDWNATTPPHPDVVAAMRRAAAESWANPSSVHELGRRARAVVEDAREATASLLSVDSRDVIFTSGGTEANNLALRGATNLLVSRLEHPSVTRVAAALAAEGRSVTWLPVTEAGRIDPEAVRAVVGQQQPGFVLALMAANHETGVIQPVPEVAEVVHAAGGRLHVDAVQAIGKIDAASWRGADSVALAAHKFGGPKNIGALAWRGAPPPPLLLGGAQERGIRPGTVDPVAAAGLFVAARRAQHGPERYASLRPLRDRLETTLAEYGDVNGVTAPRLPHVSNISIRGWRGDELVAALDLMHVCISSGSACSAGTTEVSPIISAMCGAERAASAIRISLGDATTSSDLGDALSVFVRVLRSHPSSGSGNA